MKALMFSALVLLTGCPMFTAPPTQQAPDAPVSAMDKALDATVALVDDSGRVFCAGAFHDDLIITANHCVRDAADGMIHISTREFQGDELGHFTRSFLYEVAFADEVQDIAVLSLEGSEAPRHTNLDIGPDPDFGDRCVSIGHPSGISYTVTTGIISYPLRLSEDGQIWTQASTGIWFGNSGGPLLNRYAEIIGVASFIMSRVPHLGGFVHVSQIRMAVTKAED